MVCLEELAEDVEMRLAIEIMRKLKILRLGAVGLSRSCNHAPVPLALRVAEFAPALDPRAVEKARITLLEAAHNRISLLALRKLDARLAILEGREGYLARFRIVFNGEAIVPALGGGMPEEVRISLSVEDVSALVILIAADAVSMLTEHDVRTRSDHSAAGAHKPRRGIAAMLLSSVVHNDNAITFGVCLSYILKRIKFIEGTCAHFIGLRIGILVLADGDNGNALAVLLYNEVASRVLVIFAKSGIGESLLGESRDGILNAGDAKVENVVVTDSDKVDTDVGEKLRRLLRCFEAGTVLVYSLLTVGDGTLQIDSDKILVLKERKRVLEESVYISCLEELCYPRVLRTNVTK